MRNVLLPLFLIGVLGCGGSPTTAKNPLSSKDGPPRQVQGPEGFLDQPLPNFTMEDVHGGTITNASLQGKVVVIDFWASWCRPCLAVAPDLQSLHEEYADKGVVIIGANVSERSPSASAVRSYATEHKYTYRFAWQADELKNAIGVMYLPTMLVVDRTGKVRYLQEGGGPDVKTRLENAIRPLLKE